MSVEHRPICIIFNPAAGRRRARQRLDALRGKWHDRATFWPTEGPGHAVELARRAVAEGFAVVAAAGGDGTVHEVANGLLQAGPTNVRFAVIPVGSANDYAYTLQHARITTARRVDVGVVRTDMGAARYFVCCLGLGFGGSVTAESRRITWLQGQWLYGLATLRALVRQWRCLDLSIAVDGEHAVEERALMLSLLVGEREGGFPMAPGARIDDGWLDFVRAGRLSRWEVLLFLTRLATCGLPKRHSKLRVGRCKTMVVNSRQPLAIHTDGELLCQPADGVLRVEIELHAAALLVQLGLD